MKSITAKLQVWALLVLLLPVCLTTGCTVSQVEQAANDINSKLPLLASLATAVVAIVDPQDASLVSEISAGSGKISADVTLAESIINGFSDISKIDSGSLARINAALADGKAQLANILQLVGVKNPALTAEIASWANVATTIFNDLAANIATVAPIAILEQLPVFFGPSFIRAMAMSGHMPDTYKHSGKTARQLAQEWNKACKHERAKVKVPGHVHILHVWMPW